MPGVGRKTYSMLNKHIALFSLLHIVLLDPSFAMMIHHLDIKKVLDKTEVAVIVEIQDISKPAIERFNVSIDVVARPVETLFGKPAGAILRCTYSQGRCHWRGKWAISPLVSGSGQELGLKKGDRVIFLLSLDGALLRVEPLERSKMIVEYKRARRAPADAAGDGPRR